MIEINLIPDVKQELIRARRTRNMVISFCVLASLVAGGLVALLLVYVFGVQSVRDFALNNTISSEHKKLTQVSDLSNALTIQHQLEVIPDQHGEKYMQSRVFDVLSTIVDSSEAKMTVVKFSVNTEDSLITIEGETTGGYKALEQFKKTIEATKFTYQDDSDESQTDPLSNKIIDGSRSYGETSEGQRVLRFTLDFEYTDMLLSPDAKNGNVVAPKRTNATDSAQSVPDSLFDSTAGEDE